MYYKICFLFPELTMAVFESQHFPPFTTSATGVTSALFVTAYASRVSGALLLPMSLQLWVLLCWWELLPVFPGMASALLPPGLPGSCTATVVGKGAGAGDSQGHGNLHSFWGYWVHTWEAGL